MLVSKKMWRFCGQRKTRGWCVGLRLLGFDPELLVVKGADVMVRVLVSVIRPAWESKS